MTTAQAVEAYIQARAHHDECKAVASEAYSAMMRAKARMIDEMLNEETKSIKREDGVTISLRRSFTLSVTKDNTDAIREWLIEAYGDDSPYVKEVVDKKALTDKVKAEVEAGADEQDLPEFLAVSTRPDVTVRGWRNAEKEDEDEF